MLYDAFICHASEDKDVFVRPLAEKLRESHLEIWYDEFSLKVGDSLRESIDKGLSKCRFGIVILSPAFFKKRWPKRELNGLTAREMVGGHQIILPIWHKVTAADIIKHSPPLADIKALDSKKGIGDICKMLLEKIRPEGSPLIIARDMLIEAGLNPPVVTDEWWLDVVEASNRIPNGGAVPPPDTCWGRWTFPLPGWGSRGKERGVWLAWTACQMKWEKAAEEGKITQITRPDKVLEFINSYGGLNKICHENPEYLALYAPQLTIKGLSGEFEKDFDTLLDNAIKSNNWREEIALRHPNLFGRDSANVACQFVQGDIFSPTVRYYEHFEYLIWFLSSDSIWLPEKFHKFLLDGMKKWAVWMSGSKDTYEKMEDFIHSIFEAKSYRRFRLTSRVKSSLLSGILTALKVLELKDKPTDIMNKFLDENVIETYFEENKRRHKKTKEK